MLSRLYDADEVIMSAGAAKALPTFNRYFLQDRMTAWLPLTSQASGCAQAFLRSDGLPPHARQVI